METKVITGKGRFCWPVLFEPKARKDGDPRKYSVMFLIPKSDTATIDKLRAAETEAVEVGRQKFGWKASFKFDSIIHDADEDETAEDYPERKGCLYMTVSTGEDYRPGVVGADKVEIFDKSEIYSGCYGRLSVKAYPYSGEKKGVTFALNHVQKLADGEPLDGRTSAEDDFDDDVL